VPVTDGDVEHVRRAFMEFNRRYDELGRGGVDDYHAEFYVPDGVIEHVDGFPVPGRYEGVEGYREWFGESYTPYEDVRWEILSIAPEADRVVALVRIAGRPVGNPVELEVSLGITYEMRDGRIAHSRVYLGHERAVEMAHSGG
jgi:ketosteroid isomerase-like protein